MVIDTETCDLQGSVYDVGYTICDKHGTVLKSYNALAREVFTDASRMMGAFYAKKMFTHFIILEIFLFVTLYFSSVYLVDVFGLEGAVMGHFFTHLLHFGIVILIFSSSLFGIISEDSV